jgi:hypothetical protein
MTYRARNLFAAIGLAVLAALFVGFYVSNYKKTVEHSQQHVTVFVAARDIPEGTSGAGASSERRPRGDLELEADQLARRSTGGLRR